MEGTSAEFGKAPYQPGESAQGTGDGAGDAGLRLPQIEVPKGGGAIRATAEAFSANPATGAGSLSIPIGLSPGRGGFGPRLAASYASSAGNGPLGYGWALSVAGIRRKTSRGLPRYDATDVFQMAGAEDLVPVDRAADRRDGYEIRRFMPRIEGGFARIEQWRDLSTDAVHWRTISRANITTLFGLDPRHGSPTRPIPAGCSSGWSPKVTTTKAT